MVLTLPTYQIFLVVQANILLAWHHWRWQFKLLWIIKILEIILLSLKWIVCYLSNSKSFFPLAWAEKFNAEFQEYPYDVNLWAILSHSSPSRCLHPTKPSFIVAIPNFSSSLEFHLLWDISAHKKFSTINFSIRILLDLNHSLKTTLVWNMLGF